MKTKVPVIEILALFAVVTFIFWQSQRALNTKTRWFTPPTNWSVEQRAEEIHKLRTPLPLWKELFMSDTWDQTIRKRLQRQEAAEFLAVWAEGTDSKDKENDVTRQTADVLPATPVNKQ